MTNHLFALQVLCLAILWVIKTIKSISIIFPLMVCALSVHSQKLRIDTFKCCQKWTCGWFLNTLCFQEKFYRKRQRNVGALLVGRYFCRVSVVKKDTTDWWFVNFLVQKKKKKKNLTTLPLIGTGDVLRAQRSGLGVHSPRADLAWRHHARNPQEGEGGKEEENAGRSGEGCTGKETICT